MSGEKITNLELKIGAVFWDKNESCKLKALGLFNIKSNNQLNKK